MEKDITPDWIGLDWRTDSLRGWAMQGGAVLDSALSDTGTATLDPAGFGPALDRLIASWNVEKNTPMIACGLVGAPEGWANDPYRPVPCTPLGSVLTPVQGIFHRVYVIPGLRQVTPGDLMQGEETRIAGFLALNEGWDGVICLPGTHTKWAQISAGEVVSFQTYMTGEIFALLSGASVLRASVEGGEVWHEASFDTAVEDALGRPEKLAARLFSIRADDVLDGIGADVARARLSGLLIGAELAAAKPYWLGTNIALLGNTAQAARYARALKTQGATATLTDVTRMTLAGLTAAYRHLKDQT